MLFDRIAQFKEILSLAFCIIFSVTCLVWNSSMVVQSVSNSRKLGNYFWSSFQSLGNSVGSISDKMESYDSLLEKKNRYEKKIEEYENILTDTARIKNENEKLKKLVQFEPDTPYPYVKAKVLTIRLNTIYRTIIINKGRKDGIKAFMPVIARVPEKNVKQAVVGKIIAVDETSSIIQPLVNSNFSMGVRMPGINLWAILSGNSGKGLQVMLNYIDNHALIKPPDKYRLKKSNEMSGNPDLISRTGLIGKPVFTSGGSGIFPPNIPVGVITDEGVKEGSFKTAYAEPFVNFGSLEFVTVIKKLPAKWATKWPAHIAPETEQPIFGENVFPVEYRKKLEKQKKTEKSN